MRKSPREKDGKREKVNDGRSCMTVVKAVWRGVMGFGALSPGDIDAPAEWLCGGAGYAGVRRWSNEVWFWFPALQDGGCSAEEGAVWRFAGYQGRGMGRCDGWVWLGWRNAVSGVCGYGKGGAELSGNIIVIKL